jgi:hypothetical protein
MIAASRLIEQLLGPQQRLKHRVGPARVEPRFSFRLCRREQLAYRRLHRPHALCVVGWCLGRRGVVARRRRETTTKGGEGVLHD